MTTEQTTELIGKIMKINNKLSDELFLKSLSGDVLSYIAVKMSAMKASLLDVKVMAHQDMLDKEVEMNRIKGEAFIRSMKTSNATAAKDAKYTDEEFIAAQKSYNKAKVLFERLRSIISDTHDLTDAIKSRVIDLQGARKDERIN